MAPDLPITGGHLLALVTPALPWLQEIVLSLGIDMPDMLSHMCLFFQVIMRTDSLGSLWVVLLFPLVFGVPTEEATFGESVASHLTKGCQRCCDPEEPLSPADTVHAPASPSFPYVLPEVRPYINITILKGEFSCRENWYGLGREGQKKAGQALLALPALDHSCVAPRMCKDCSEFRVKEQQWAGAVQ